MNIEKGKQGFQAGKHPWNYGKKLSKAHIAHMRASSSGFQAGDIPWNKGKKGKGHPAWNKGKKGLQVAWNKGGTSWNKGLDKEQQLAYRLDKTAPKAGFWSRFFGKRG